MTATPAAGAWAVYDTPELCDQVSLRRDDGLREALFKVEGMHCVNCVRNLESTLAPLVRSVRVDLAAATAELRWDEESQKLSGLLQAIERAGYRPSPLQAQPEAEGAVRERRGLLLRLGVAGLLSMQVMMLAGTQYFVDVPLDPALELLLRYAQWVLATPVLLYAGLPFLRSAAASLRARRMNMDVPVSLALLLAYTASCANLLLARGHVYFDSVTMFVFLLLAARWFEGNGRARAARRLRELASAQPLSALRRTAAGDNEEVAASALRAGDILVIPPGAAAAADGRLIGAVAAAFDESLLTGEALPRVKQQHARVHAGAVNAGSAPAEVLVDEVGASTTLSQITRLMHRAQAERPRVQQLADRAAGWIVAGVLLAAAAGAAWWWPTSPETAFQVALAVLVVTCPCALSLATPLALAAASSGLAARGVLVAHADALLRLPQVDTVCFDKTGTLTTGRMRCLRVEPASGHSQAECLAIAAALERDIRHPVATAFAAMPATRRATAVETLAGRGVRGVVDGSAYELVASEGAGELTWLSLRRVGAEGDQEIGRLGLEHQLRAEAAAAVAALRARGLALELLSGDAPANAEATARALGIATARGGITPDGKLAHLRALQAAGHRVWMIGDGINDAPVLAGADVSTSLAGAAALAQARADLLITQASLQELPAIYDGACRTQAVVRQNLVWAAAYNLVAVPLALAGMLTPWIAALGMGLSSVTVVVNALRLARRPPPPAARRGAASLLENMA